MAAYTAQGQRHLAGRTYARCRAGLREFGVEPSAALERGTRPRNTSGTDLAPSRECTGPGGTAQRLCANTERHSIPLLAGTLDNGGRAVHRSFDAHFRWAVDTTTRLEENPILGWRATAPAHWLDIRSYCFVPAHHRGSRDVISQRHPGCASPAPPAPSLLCDGVSLSRSPPASSCLSA